MAIDGRLLVDTQDLATTAQEIQSISTQTNGLTQQMLQLVRGMSSFYQGDDATNYLNKFNALESDMQKMFSMIKEQADDLLSMKVKFDGVNTTTVNTTSGLKQPVIP